MEQKRKKYKEELWGFGVAVEKKDGKLVFRDSDDNGDKLWGHIRAWGYASAIIGEFVGRVRIFCPTVEYATMRDSMISYGAGAGLIEHHHTSATTWGNGRVMKIVQASRSLRRDHVYGSSSGYHIRAPYFGNEHHDLRITFVPAEAFIFAAAPKEEHGKIFENLVAEFGGDNLTRRQVRDWQGIGDDLAGRYKVPPQPQD